MVLVGFDKTPWGDPGKMCWSISGFPHRLRTYEHSRWQNWETWLWEIYLTEKSFPKTRPQNSFQISVYFPKGFAYFVGPCRTHLGPYWAQYVPILEFFHGLRPLLKCYRGYKIPMAIYIYIYMILYVCVLYGHISPYGKNVFVYNMIRNKKKRLCKKMSR